MVEPAFKKLTRTEMFQIGNLILAHCKKTEDGHAEYEAGWDDVRVHAESGTHVTVASISHLRLELVGRIRIARWTEAKEIQTLKARLDAMELRALELSEWAAARPVQPFRYERGLK